MIDVYEKHKFGTISRTSCVPDEFYSVSTHFLLCFDESENAEFAFQWTMANIFREGDHLMMVHILPELDITDMYLMGYDFVDDIKQAAITEVILIFRNFKLNKIHTSHEKEMQKSFNSFKLTTFVRLGEAREEIMNITTELKPHLLILGSRGLGFVKRMIFGSVSQHCMHHSSVPILIVPLAR